MKRRDSELKPEDFSRIGTLFVPETVSSMAISPAGGYAVIAAGDKLHVHQVLSRPPGHVSTNVAAEFPRLVTLYMPDKVQSVSFSADGKLLFVAIADKVHIYSVPAV